MSVEENYKVFKEMMEIIINLLNESRISKYVKDTGKHDSLYAEVKTLGENVKSKLDVSAELDEIATRNFISKAQKLLTEVWKYKTEEERIEKKTYLNALKDADNKLNNILNEANEYSKNLSISTYRKSTLESPGNRMRSYVMVVILIAIIIGLIFISGKLHRDLYPFLLFILIISFPLIVIFRRDIYKILPIKIGTSRDHVERKVVKKANNKYSQDMSKTAGIIFLNLFAIMMLITQSDKFFGVMLAAMSSIFAGVLVFDI